MGRSSLWSISWLRHQMFYPYIMISVAQARESDDLHHAMSPFSLFLSSFSGAQRILGYVRPWRIVVVDPPKTKRRSIWRSLQIGAAFAWRSDGLTQQDLSLELMKISTHRQHPFIRWVRQCCSYETKTRSRLWEAETKSRPKAEQDCVKTMTGPCRSH